MQGVSLAAHSVRKQLNELWPCRHKNTPNTGRHADDCFRKKPKTLGNGGRSQRVLTRRAREVIEPTRAGLGSGTDMESFRAQAKQL